MIHRSQFGVGQKDSLAKTFFSNDWTHCILERRTRHNQFSDTPSCYKYMAKVLLSTEMAISVGAMVLFNYYSDESLVLSLSAIWAFVISIMGISNATKNQTDSVSRYMQSYWTKSHNSVFYLSMAMFYDMEFTGSFLFTLFGLTLLADASVGFYVLHQLFSTEKENIEIMEGFLSEEEPKQIVKRYNDRVPRILKSNQLLNKLFTKGWKFNLFNKEGFVNQQIAAIAVIFALFNFSVVNIITGDELVFSISALTYSLISMFTFMNLSYVRDFDALQVNATPILMGLIGMHLGITEGFSYPLAGTTASLVADSFFALRYQEMSDHIDYTPLEQFSMVSWTQGAFEQSQNLTLQLASTSMIFLQMFLNTVGAVEGDHISMLIGAFYILRLMQYIFNTGLGIQIAQSNSACVLLAMYGLTNFASGTFSSISTIVLLVDAYIGAYVFVSEREEDLGQYLGYFRKNTQRPIAQSTSDNDGNRDNSFHKI